MEGRDEIGRAFRGSSALHAVGDCTPSATVTCYWRGLQRKLGNDSRARVCWICRIQGARAYVGYVEYRARPVFWSVNASDLPNVHFDTNHYQHTVWKTYEELRASLAEKIEAILGRGPSKN